MITAQRPTLCTGSPPPHKRPSASADVQPLGGENSVLTTPMGIGVPRPDVSWILSNLKTNDFGESQFLT